MRFVNQALTALIGVAGVVFLPVHQLVAESIYHWKDRNGISCYSNTNIPGGATEISVMSSAWSAVSQAGGSDTADDVDAGENETSAVEGSETVFDSRAGILQSRIERRQASIQYIETLLKTNPNDAGLRQSLYRKKQSLHEDITRLKFLTK